MKKKQAIFVHGPELDQYRYPPESPFNTTRAARTRKIVKSMYLLPGATSAEATPTPASRETLEGFHLPDYLDALELAAEDRLLSDQALTYGLGTLDCPIFPDIFRYPSWAVGATLTAVDLVLEQRTQVAFNPSGGFHHAAAGMAAGFCYLNDVVLACQRLCAAGRRVLFLDVDVHHCDGVQDAFWRSAEVMTISLHEDGRTLFPGTGAVGDLGEAAGRGYCVNVPVPVGTYDEAYLRAFNEIVLPLIGAYDPDVIVLELGMDGLAGDPLAHLNLTNNAYAAVAEAVMECGRPIVATGGGGYDVDRTTRAWALLWSVFCGEGADNDMILGLGGVMLENVEWHGGLRDRPLLSDGGQRHRVDVVVDAVIAELKRTVFPLHGLC